MRTQQSSIKQAALLCAALCVPAMFVQSAMAQSISLSPGYTTIGVNQQLQYTATVTGLANTTVTWQVVGITGGNSTYGTITQTGLYTAPATIPANGITVIALANDKKTMAVTYVNVAPAGPTITSVSPMPVPTGSYNVIVTGVGFKSGATVQAGGANLPTTFVNSTTLKVSGWQGTATKVPFMAMNAGSLWGPIVSIPFVAAGPPPPQTIAPASVSVTLGTTQQFTSANATGFTASVGTVTPAGLYTAPATMPASGIATVTATGPGGTATASISLVSTTPQTIAPTAVSLNLGATQQFTSAGATMWSATYGSVTANGLYTAPVNTPATLVDTVKAIGPNGTAAASVTLILPTPVITGITVNGTPTNSIPLGAFTMTISGTGFTGKSTILLGNATANLTGSSANGINVSGFASVSGNVNLVVSNGAVSSAPYPITVGVSNAQVSAAAARRFLEQGAFGPSPKDAAHVQQVGFQGWLNEQFTMPQVSDYSRLAGSSQGGILTAFLTNATMNADQLRQRVGFAYSQLFVTSISKLIFNGNVIPYQTMLLNDAFKNYRQILSDVTLSGAMGYYLDMGNNAKANPNSGSVANENYAREILQLFSIGTKALNQDGTVITDAIGNPIPTYSQFTVTEFARVFTGWTFAPAQYWGQFYNATAPMQPWAPMHDAGGKTLLNGVQIQAGLSPQADVDAALDNIFNHPNVGPFVGRNLIQHLVKSNPSPAYIQRVAAVFANNGQGVRGDMQAVITAILLDPEARANDNGGNDQVADGHLTEPLLLIPAIYRAMGGSMADTNYFGFDLYNLNEDLYNSPSVFNYFSPFFHAPGTPLYGPEFQIDTPNNAVYRANMLWNMIAGYQSSVIYYGPSTDATYLDETPFLALAQTPATLVDALDLTFTHGTMPPALKSLVVAAATADTNGNYSRVQTAIYTIISSGYYSVWH